MCFSPEVDFIASGFIGVVGVATLAHVRQPRAVLFAATPIFFALHQFTEGFVWLGLEGKIRPEAQVTSSSCICSTRRASCRC
jgi:hypothetical protein